MHRCGLEQHVPVTGSFKVKTSGATATSTHAEITAQSTLNFAGQKSALDGALTLVGANGSGLTNK